MSKLTLAGFRACVRRNGAFQRRRTARAINVRSSARVSKKGRAFQVTSMESLLLHDVRRCLCFSCVIARLNVARVRRGLERTPAGERRGQKQRVHYKLFQSRHLLNERSHLLGFGKRSTVNAK